MCASAQAIGNCESLEFCHVYSYCPGRIFGVDRDIVSACITVLTNQKLGPNRETTSIDSFKTLVIVNSIAKKMLYKELNFKKSSHNDYQAF